MDFQHKSYRTVSLHWGNSKPTATSGDCTISQLPPLPFVYQVAEDQLTKWVLGIFDGIIMLEKGCDQMAQSQSTARRELSSQEWQVLIGLHQILLEEYHNFFMNTLHPSAGRALRELPDKYRVPARLWRYGIQILLELLFRQLPGSLEYMMKFTHLAYSMLILFLETVPAFKVTWVEHLGALSMWVLAIEGKGSLDDQIWTGIARHWSNKASANNPGIGRIQYNLGVVAKPDIAQQLFYFTKSLVCVRPDQQAKESILHLVRPLLHVPGVDKDPGATSITTAFVSIHGHLFTQAPVADFLQDMDRLYSILAWHIPRGGMDFQMQGVYLMSTIFAAILEYGKSNSLIHGQFQGLALQHLKPSPKPFPRLSATEDPVNSAREAVQRLLALGSQRNPSQLAYGSSLAFGMVSVMLDYVNKNVIPALHTSLAFLWCLSHTATGMGYVESLVPWRKTVEFLNRVIQACHCPGIVNGRKYEFDFNLVQKPEFPIPHPSPWLPEDFLIRGQIWSDVYYPLSFFNKYPFNEDGQIFERQPQIISRNFRCLWLGVRLAEFNRWIVYYPASRRFSVTPFAVELEKAMQTESKQTLPDEAQTFRECLRNLPHIEC